MNENYLMGGSKGLDLALINHRASFSFYECFIVVVVFPVGDRFLLRECAKSVRRKIHKFLSLIDQSPCVRLMTN
jgi:hypothetical protein